MGLDSTTLSVLMVMNFSGEQQTTEKVENRKNAA